MRLNRRIHKLEQIAQTGDEPLRLIVIYEDHAGDKSREDLSEAMIDALWDRAGQPIIVNFPHEGNPEKRARPEHTTQEEGMELRRRLCTAPDPSAFVSSLTDDQYKALMRQVGYFPGVPQREAA